MPPAVGAAIAGAATAGASIYGANKSASSSDRATRASVDAANRAAELEAKSAQDALDFAKTQEATRKAEWEATQQRNFEQYLAQQARLAPWRRLGVGSIGQLAQPIPTMTTAPRPSSGGSIADLIGG